MHFSSFSPWYRGFAHQKMRQEQAVVPVPPAMLRTSPIASVTNDTISIVLFSHLESTAKPKDLLQS